MKKIIAATLLAFSVICLTVACHDTEKNKDNLSLKWREIWCEDVTVSVGGKTVFDFGEVKHTDCEIKKGSTVTVTNNGTKAVTVILYAEGYTVFVDVQSGSSADCTWNGEAGNITELIGIMYGETACYYASSADAVILGSEMPSADTVILTADVKTAGDFVLPSPVKLVTNDHTISAGGKLGIDTDKEGSFEIWNASASEIISDGFFAECPNADVYVNMEYYELADTKFYITAKSYNGTKMSSDVKLVKTRAQLNDLTNTDEYPKLRENMTVRIDDGFVLDGENAVFTEPITLVIDGDITRDGVKFVFDTDKAGTISVKNIGEAEITADYFLFDCPDCDFETYECDIDIYELIDEALYSFHGVKLSDCTLGGEGTERLIGLRMTAEDNRGLSADVSWTVYGSYAYATVDCVVDPERLHAVKLTASVSGGEASFTSSFDGTVDLLADTGCFCTVTDADGNINRYAVMIEYVPTKLPIVVIDVENDEEITSLEDYLRATIRIECDNTNGEYPSLAETTVNIRGRGNSTWDWAKKPYKLKFDSKTSVLGMTANKKWTLLANYADKSLIRNYVALKMAAALDGMPFATSQYPVDVFLNGKYVGVYTLGEQIEVKKGRVDIEVSEDTNVLDTGYLLQIGGTTSADTWDVTCFRTTLLRYVKIEAPLDELLTRARVAYIKDYCLKADEAVKAGEGYEEYIDVDALADWCILHELTFNLDSCFHRSVFIVKQTGGILQMGPAWDFDLALGNMSRDYNKYDIWLIPGKNDSEAYIKLNWLNYLYTNEAFVRKMEERWNEIKDELLAVALTAVDEMSAKVAPSAKYNFEVWQILGIKVAFEPKYTNQYDTYEKQIGYLRSFIETRWQWIDENISKLPLTSEETDILPKTTETAEK